MNTRQRFARKYIQANRSTLREGGYAKYQGRKVSIIGLDSNPLASVLIVDSPLDPDAAIYVSRDELEAC